MKLRGKREKIYICIAVLVILILSLKNINKLVTISIIGDEFGYWLGGAFFSGTDWTGAAVRNAYYSWGYGVILAPLFRIFESSISMYQAAIIINAALLVLSFCMAYLFVKKLLWEQCVEIRILAALVPVLYVSNLFYVQVTMAETLLSFLFWCVCYLSICALENNRKALWAILSFLVIYMFFVHQRSIAVLAAFVLCALINLCKKKDFKSFFVFILFLLFFSLIGQYIKGKFQLYLSLGSEIRGSDPNEFSSQLSKIQYLFTIDGILSLFKGILGKIFYLGSATFLLFYVGMYKMISAIRKKEQCIEMKIFYIFLILCCLFAVGISTLFMIYSTDNVQRLMYGRYNEYIIQPILLLGLICIWKEEISIRKMIQILMVHFILGFIVISSVNIEISNSDYNWSSVIAFSDVWMRDHDTYKLLLFNILRSASIFWGWIIAQHFGKKASVVVAMVCILVWCNISFKVSDNIMFSFRDRQSETNIELCELIETEYYSSKIYYIEKDEDATARIDYMQFLLKDKKVYLVRSTEQLKELEDGIILSSIGQDATTEYMRENYQQIGQSAIYYLWK